MINNTEHAFGLPKGSWRAVLSGVLVIGELLAFFALVGLKQWELVKIFGTAILTQGAMAVSFYFAKQV